MTTPIVLCTLNARYIHSSLGLRYLLANMGPLREKTRLIEYTINQRPIDIVENLLAEQPEIIGLGVYIWNAAETTEVVRLLKSISPQTCIILGGPEVSYETEQQEITRYADYVITGQGDITFGETCVQILENRKPLNRIITPGPIRLDELVLPYREYSEADIAQRVIYVEASRGCPFKCEFCLSALDKTAYPFDIDLFLDEMQHLYDRGARSFKFIDRTFNLKIDNSIRILEFFLEKMQQEKLYLHFELIPDHLPEKLKDVLEKFPEHSLQFEIGVQSLNPDTQALISRRQDNVKTLQNLHWIRQHTGAHIHADLIIGLPGENMESFANGFNQLVQANPHEIQVGILKRLRGTPIIRHTEEYGMVYNPYPPYDILYNRLIDFPAIQKLKRFARYWDMIANSGRFKYSKPLFQGKQAFENFMALSEWIYEQTGQTHNIALPRLFSLLYRAMTDILGLDEASCREVLLQDHAASGIKGPAKFLDSQFGQQKEINPGRSESRQKRHQA